MALPDYPDLVAGAAKTWDSAGTSGALTLTSLANGAGREGAKLDFNDVAMGLPELIEVRFETAVAVAATNGNQIELYFGESDDAVAGNANPGNLTGADAALATPDELKLQCNFIGGLNLSNARGTNAQKQRFLYFPTCRYLIPLVVNKSGQTLHATAGNHKIVATPYYREIKD